MAESEFKLLQSLFLTTANSSAIQSMSESSGVFLTNPDSQKPTQSSPLRKPAVGFNVGSEAGLVSSPAPRELIA